MPRGLSAAARRRLTIGLAVATTVIGGWLVLGGRRQEPVASPPPAPSVATVEVAPPEQQQPPVVVPPGDCEALAAQAVDGGPDAVLLAWLCPDRPLDAVAARAALLAVRSPDEAAALAPRLHEHPTSWGLATLVAQTRVEPPVTDLPRPDRAVVSPLSATVLAQVQRAHAVIAAPGIAPAQRTRARALVAKVYLQATQQLGLSVGRPTSPLLRLLAGRALHYGREFCVAYWRNRVSGLAPLFAEVETRLLELTLALEATPHHGDAARLVVTLELTRQYLRGDGPQSRIERRLASRTGTTWGPSSLAPLPNAVDRLLEHGLVDLAISRGLDEGRRAGGPGLRAMDLLLHDRLAQAERDEYRARLQTRLRRVRARTPPPSETGSGSTPHAAEPRWIGAQEVADDAARFIERAATESGFTHRYSLGRALLILRERPDAVPVLLSRAADDAASEALALARGWLGSELAARDDGRRAWLRHQVAAEGRPTPASDGATPDHAAEAARRRRFALKIRQADRLARGAGLGRHTAPARVGG